MELQAKFKWLTRNKSSIHFAKEMVFKDHVAACHTSLETQNLTALTLYTPFKLPSVDSIPQDRNNHQNHRSLDFV